MCQLNPIVGDLDGNVARVLEALERAERAEADVAVFTELVITGYPPEDLLLKPRFVADNRAALDRVAAATGRCAAVVGFVDAEGALYNAAAVCAGGVVQGIYRKRLLPNYTVFDEKRYFVPGEGPAPLFDIAGVRAGVSVCEDAWSANGPIAEQGAAGAQLILNINASPYYESRYVEREAMLAARAAEAGCPIVYVNQVGGQDELVFDGASVVVGEDGVVRARGAQFAEDFVVVDVDVATGEVAAPAPALLLAPVEEVYEALVLGTRDYALKNGFTDVVLGMSGGVDSSLVACIAADALGPERVHGVALPSRFTSDDSNDHASQLADKLGIDFRSIAIEPAHSALLGMLRPSFEGLQEDITEENIQGRIRAVLLMALANKFRTWLVLICGNKSELAVGYTTVYGVDMAGGFAVIKDVFKTQVYDLARERNRRAGTDLIPEAVLTKPPSAELRPDQRDDDNLPPYDVLDPLLEAYVEQDKTAAELEEAGFDAALVRRIVRMVDVAEWKRRQAPPGVRVTPKAFGKDRRMPITNRYSG